MTTRLEREREELRQALSTLGRALLNSREGQLMGRFLDWLAKRLA